MTERPSAHAALMAFLFGLFSMTALNLFGLFVANLGFKMGNFVFMYTTIFEIVAFAVPAISYYFANPAHRPAFRFRGMDPLCAAMIVLSAVVGMLALNWLSVYWAMILRALGLVLNTGSSLVPTTVEQLLLSLFSVALVPAFCEELLFRGFLLPSLEKMGSWKAALISGAMFALLHGRIEALPAHLLMGGMLAWLVLKTDSLFSAILYHAVYNAAITLTTFFFINGDPFVREALPTAGEALDMLPNAVLLIGVWGMLFYGAMERGERKKRRFLATAERQPLSLRARVLLGVSGALLVGIELTTLLGMLPGSGT